MPKTQTPAWPKLEIIGTEGQRERIVELAAGAEFGIPPEALERLRSGRAKGVSICDGREAFVYTEQDAARDAGPALLAAVRAALPVMKKVNRCGMAECPVPFMAEEIRALEAAVRQAERP